MKNLIKNFLSDEQGLETVEWAVMAGLIVVALIATVTSLGTKVNTKITALEQGL